MRRQGSKIDVNVMAKAFVAKAQILNQNKTFKYDQYVVKKPKFSGEDPCLNCKVANQRSQKRDRSIIEEKQKHPMSSKILAGLIN